jgi:ribulose-5-phosphate 4-epimerase/fuculose-1-phosphate aldolase
MTVDEGYIKYQSFWSKAPVPHAAVVDELETWRRPLFEAGLIGEYEEHGIGYGNISIRCGEPGQFLISGTQTGHLPRTDRSHYALVTSWSVHGNLVCCAGPVQASSEAMTHAAIYQLDQQINAIVHVHSKELWCYHMNSLPTTAPEVPYGTPEMANEFRRLYRDSAFRKTRLAVMGGHEDGIVSVGATLEAAAEQVLQLQQAL